MQKSEAASVIYFVQEGTFLESFWTFLTIELNVGRFYVDGNFECKLIYTLAGSIADESH